MRPLMRAPLLLTLPVRRPMLPALLSTPLLLTQAPR